MIIFGPVTLFFFGGVESDLSEFPQLELTVHNLKITVGLQHKIFLFPRKIDFSLFQMGLVKTAHFHYVIRQWVLYSLECCDNVGWVTGRPSGLLVCWCWWFDWSCAHITAPVITTTSIILSSNKIQNRDILVPAWANPGSPGWWPLKWERVSEWEREREREILRHCFIAWFALGSQCWHVNMMLVQ